MKILETFRDSIQGLDWFVDTKNKIRILNALLHVGFEYLDVGSFVSPRIIPQFSDMNEVLNGLDTWESKTKIFTLVANQQGASEACKYEQVDVLGFPFSTSETFLKRNINIGFDQAEDIIHQIQDECVKNNKTLIVYLAMAFGNPYGDPVNIEICHEWVDKFHGMGINYIHLSDIIGVASAPQIEQYYHLLNDAFKEVEFGLHIHTGPQGWEKKLDAAWRNGCQIFDGAISGLGGCPMTGYEMLQNLPTSHLLKFASDNRIELELDETRFEVAKEITNNLLIRP